eukprot:Hpha_TRINITY_DN3302_c0_g1::TRINITY_DN3302_c0_g1_i1::g.172465::m.172465
MVGPVQPETLELLRDMRLAEHTDVRVGTLDLLFNVLQRAGQELTPASWRTALAILSASSQQAAEVALGFKGVVLVCSDFMPILDSQALLSLIACVGHFAQQEAIPEKTNANLSSIQLTLSIADFCSSHASPRVGTAHWRALFGHLREAATDSRPEVRQSALKTLFTALVTHGGGLPIDCWDGLFWEVLLRVVENVARAAAAAEREGSPRVAGATGKGIIMHHSRNTTAKQWHETLCTALEGVTRIVRVFLPTITGHVGDCSTALLRVASQLAAAAAHSSEEVAVVGVKGLKFLLMDAGCSAAEGLAASLWETAWRTWEHLANAAASEVASAAVLSCMVECVAEVHVRARQEALRCDGHSALAELAAQRTMRLLPLLEKVMRSPAAAEGAASPTKLQACVFDCLQAQVPFALDDAWLAALAQLAGYLPPAGLVDAARAPDAGPAAVRALQQFGSVRLCERALGTLRHVFAHPLCPPQVKASSFPNLVKALTPTLMTRHIVTARYDVSQSGAEAFSILTRSALPLYAEGDFQRHCSPAWDAVCSLCCSFFSELPQREVGAEGLEVVLLRMVRDDLLPHCRSRGEAGGVCGRLLGLLRQCAALEGLLGEASADTLFALCSAPPEADEWPQEAREVVGRAALPTLLAHCDDTLRRFVTDEQQSGRCALPRVRRDRVAATLSRLRHMQADARCFGDDAGEGLRTSCPAAYGPRGVIVRLHPALAAFVSCRDDALRGEVAELLGIISGELGLERVKGD